MLQCSAHYIIVVVLQCFAVLQPTRCSRLLISFDRRAIKHTVPAADVMVLKEWLDALVVNVEAAEEKAATAHRRILAARQLLDEELATTDLERQAAIKKLVSGSTSFSTTETATASSSYVDTIVANLHIHADIMMEEIHLDTSSLAAAPTVFYYNKTLFAPLSPPLAPPCPPDKNNGSGPGNDNDSNNNRHRNNNCRNDGSDGKNNDNDENHGGNTSRNTTVFTILLLVTSVKREKYTNLLEQGMFSS
jgi:hypothetical protein